MGVQGFQGTPGTKVGAPNSQINQDEHRILSGGREKIMPPPPMAKKWENREKAKKI